MDRSHGGRAARPRGLGPRLSRGSIHRKRPLQADGLQSASHRRSGRYNGVAYTSTFFDLNTPAKTGALYNLAQHHGFLTKKGEGHARFDLFDLGRIFATKLLSDRGVSLGDAASVSEFCGMGIGYRALESVDAYEGDHLRTNEARGLSETYPSSLVVESAKRLVEERGGELPADFGARPQWGEKGEWLARQVYRDRFNTGMIPAPLFIWWADGQHVFHHSFDNARSETTTGDPRLSGPAIVLDFDALAHVISDRAGRAFVHVEFPGLPPLTHPEINAERQSMITEPGASAPGQNEDDQA